MNFGMPAGKRTVCATPVGMIIRNHWYTKRWVQIPIDIIIGGKKIYGAANPGDPPVSSPPALGLHVHASFYVDMGDEMWPALYYL